MKALTLKQPWATLISEGLKEYEFRSWNTNYRGKLLIHAGLGIDKKEAIKYKYEYPKSRIVALVELVDCIKIDDKFNKMIKDYTRLMKYKPKKLKPIPLEDKLERLENNKKNLKSAKSIITELIISGKQIREYKKRKGFFEKKVASKIEELIPKRVKLIDLLRKSPEIMDDLYVFAIKAPFNEENGYINYLIVKSDPKNMIKKEN